MSDVETLRQALRTGAINQEEHAALSRITSRLEAAERVYEAAKATADYENFHDPKEGWASVYVPVPLLDALRSAIQSYPSEKNVPDTEHREGQRI